MTPTAIDLEGLRALLTDVRGHLAQAVSEGWYEETATPLHEAMVKKIDAALPAAVERAPHGDAGGGADPNCPDCLGEGRNIVSFDPPASYPCACTFTEGEMKEMAGRRALDGEKS
jgi:hypothetical protein